MKNDIKPVWEDDNNKNGGSFLLNYKIKLFIIRGIPRL